MTYALREAGMKPEDLDYVNVHGTSTPLGDPQEVKAIQKGIRASRLSTKH